jgi:hypothetical protein
VYPTTQCRYPDGDPNNAEELVGVPGTGR